MTTAITTVAKTCAKLIRLLGSDREGEVLASVHALRRVLAGAGLSLHDLANAIEVPVRSYDQRHDEDWRAIARACVGHLDLLLERERVFVRSMILWRGIPSDRQINWLVSIFTRIREAA